MTDEDLHPETGDNPTIGDEPSGRPRWVKVSLIIAAIIALVLVILLLLSGGHGPGRHMALDGGGLTQQAHSRRAGL
jgi:hypothetical protein